MNIDKKKVKVQVAHKGSLFHYAHFICDCLYPEINAKLYEYDEVIRQKHIRQTLGNFSKIYEDVMKTSYVEISPKVFDSVEAKRVHIDRNNYLGIENFKFFREFIFNRYKVQKLPKYPEIILIERGERKELISDPDLKRANTNITTGKERREIEHIDELKEFMSKQFGNKFKTLIMENLSFEEQVKHFFNANMIIAVHGAALSNMLFCRQKTKILEVLGDRTWRFFDVISNKLKLNHRKCENKIELIKNQILSFYNEKELTTNEIFDKLIDLIKTKRQEISKNRSNQEVPTIYYIGMEKTGSKSLLYGFPNNMVAHWHSTQYFEMKHNTKLLSSNDLDLYDLIIYIGKKYNFVPLIIECIREPISQITSAIMQHFKKYNKNNCKCELCKNMGENEKFLEKIKEMVTVNNWLHFPTRGFQSIKMWKKHFDIDLLQAFKQNNCFYELPEIKVLLIKLEDASKRELLFEKIGYKYEDNYANSTENNKKVANIYKFVKKNLRFSEEELNEIYANEVRVFYKRDEIERFKDTWREK